MNEQRRKTVIVVLGNQLTADGQLVPCFKERLKAGFSELRHLPNALMVITGGQTRAGYASEAAVGLRYIMRHLLLNTQKEAALGARILLETEALSTSEHPRLVRKLLADRGVSALDFVFVTSEHHVPRARRLFQKLWPNSQKQARWIGVVGHSTKRDWQRERLLRLLEILDPQETWLMPWLKRRCRNGD